MRFLIVWLFLAAVPFTPALDWPQWRGPDSTGISKEKLLLEKWPDAGPPIIWKANVGTGFSSFAIAMARAVTMGNSEEQDTVFCFDALTGRELWKFSYPAALGDKYFEGGPTSTPTIAGDHVYALSRWGEIYCFALDNGAIVWKRNLQADADARIPGWGFAGSPTVFENSLLLNIGEGGVALDKTNGKTIWQSASKEAGYTTPLPWIVNGRRQILIGNALGFIGVDLADGKELWRYKWLTQYGVNAADPIIDGERIFISSGYGKGCALIKPGAGGEPETIWRSKVLRTQMNGAVLLGTNLFGIDGDSTDKPVLKCVDLNTGDTRWSDSTTAARSLLIAGDSLITLGERGELCGSHATPEKFKPIARAQILGGKCWTPPALANGLLYARNARGDVVCVDLRGNAGK